MNGVSGISDKRGGDRCGGIRGVPVFFSQSKNIALQNEHLAALNSKI